MHNHQNIYNNPPPADFTLAVEIYLKILRKLRSQNTLVNQQISAEESIENIKNAESKRIWFDIYLNTLKQSQLEDAVMLEEVRIHYEKMLKFAQDNPIIMTTGILPKEWDIILELERKKAIYELEKTIKELEKIIAALSDRYHILCVETIRLKKEIDDIDEQCHEAAVNLFTPPEDPDKSTDINLAEITALQPYLPDDASKHILKVNHRSIVNRYKEKIDSNPNNINDDRIKSNFDQAVIEEVQSIIKKHAHLHFPQIPTDKQDEAANQIIKEHAQNINIDIQANKNTKCASFIEKASQERDKKASQLAEVSQELEGVSNLLLESENKLQSIKNQKNLIAKQGASPIRAEIEKSSLTTSNGISTNVSPQTKNTSAFIKKQPISPNLSTLEATNTEKSPNAQSPEEAKAAKNDSAIQLDEKKDQKREDKTANFDEKKSAVTVQKSETETTQKKRPARAVKVIPGQKPDEQKPEAANDSTFKLRS